MYSSRMINNERHYYNKLELIKEIRDKTIALQNLKVKIVREVKISEDEEKCLEEYRKEMESLLEEKMSHVEELRQIHADINDMENIIKQTKDSQNRSVDVANRVYEEYLALKYQVDHMRREYLGLGPLRDLHEEEGSPISKDRFQSNFLKVAAASAAKLASVVPQSTGLARPHPRHPLIQSTETAAAGPPSGNVSGPQSGSVSAFLPPSAASMNMRKTEFAVPAPPPPRIPQTPSIGIGHHPTFRSDFNVSLRQQPPPMKSCLSCHQQIHRNAPICPLCKAKSRSRNPKKPKKKNN